LFVATDQSLFKRVLTNELAYMYFSRYYLTKLTLVTTYVHGTITDNY